MSLSREERRIRLLCHDPNYVDVRLDFYDRAVGEALLTNAFISKIEISVGSILEAVLQGSDIQPLLTFIETSQPLDELVLSTANDDAARANLPPQYNNLTAQIRGAASQSTSIAEFSVDVYCAQSQVALAGLIQTSNSMSKLTLGMWDGVEADEMIDIAHSLRHNAALDTLDLYVMCDPDIVEPIFENFHHLARLVNLDVDNGAGTVGGARGLSRLLATTRTLQHLGVEHCELKENFKDVWDAIAANQTLTSIDISNCSFHRDSGRRFTEAMKHCHDVNLKIWWCTFQGTTNADVVADLVSSSDNIVEFYSPDRTHVTTLFRKLGSPANTRIRESSSRLNLHISTRRDADIINDLSTHLSPVLNLTHLTLSSISDPTQAALLVPAFRQNGSLHDVTLSNVDDEAPTHRKAMRLVKAFGKRNKRIPMLLRKACRSKEEALRIPTLLDAMKPVIRLAPHRGFAMALSQGMNIGPLSACDRLRVAS